MRLCVGLGGEDQDRLQLVAVQVVVLDLDALELCRLGNSGSKDGEVVCALVEVSVVEVVLLLEDFLFGAQVSTRPAQLRKETERGKSLTVGMVRTKSIDRPSFSLMAVLRA